MYCHSENLLELGTHRKWIQEVEEFKIASQPLDMLGLQDILIRSDASVSISWIDWTLCSPQVPG